MRLNLGTHPESNNDNFLHKSQYNLLNSVKTVQLESVFYFDAGEEWRDDIRTLCLAEAGGVIYAQPVGERAMGLQRAGPYR